MLRLSLFRSPNEQGLENPLWFSLRRIKQSKRDISNNSKYNVLNEENISEICIHWWRFNSSATRPVDYRKRRCSSKNGFVCERSKSLRENLISIKNFYI